MSKETKSCPYCQTVNNIKEEWCIKCGFDFNPNDINTESKNLICPKCETYNKNNAKFCTKCWYIFCPDVTSSSKDQFNSNKSLNSLTSTTSDTHPSQTAGVILLLTVIFCCAMPSLSDFFSPKESTTVVDHGSSTSSHSISGPDERFYYAAKEYAKDPDSEYNIKRLYETGAKADCRAGSGAYTPGQCIEICRHGGYNF